MFSTKILLKVCCALLVTFVSSISFGASSASSTNACGAASSSSSASNVPTSPLSCAVTVVNKWGGGYQTEIKITNNSISTTDNWALVLEVGAGETLASAWNTAQMTQGQNSYTFVNLNWNGTIPSKQSVAFGAIFNFSGTTHSIPKCRVSNSAVNRPPVASFTATVKGASAYIQAESLNDPDGDKLTHIIDFGDGKSINYPNAWHTYKTPGNYVVTQTVSDGKVSVVKSQTISVGAAGANRAPIGIFSYYTSGLRAVVNASASGDQDGNALSYSWDFGQGMLPATTNGLSSTTLPEGGGYITLTVFDGELGNTMQTWINASSCSKQDHAPQIIFTSKLINNSLTLDASDSINVDSFTWDFGDGATAKGMFANHNYAQPGSYNLVVRATSGVMSGGRTETIVVRPEQPNLPPEAQLFCTGSPRTVEDPVTHLPVSTYDLNCSAKGSSDPEGAALSYLISWGDGSAQEASTDGSFYHSYSIINSAFSVTLSVSDGVNTTEKTVNYQTLPSDTNLPPIAKLSCSESQTSSGTTVTFTTHCDATGSSDPEGRALTYQLNWGDNQTDMSTTGRFSHTYSVGGAYNITLLVRDGVKGTYKTLNWRATAPIR